MPTPKSVEIIQELVESFPEFQCPFCSNTFPQARLCWLVEASKSSMADIDLMSDAAREKMTHCKNPEIVALVKRYRATS